MKTRNGFNYMKIEVGREGGVDVYGYGTYPRSSVLAGQTRRVFLDSFNSFEEAKAAYPKAEGDGKTSNKFMFSNDPLGPVAPGWFDESAAGERYDSDY